jgi:6-pyruvoyltetrahydropterin/6-carboxytetrahydropterin synthase
MLSLTKVFHFETGHALNEYEGACKNIHGHSYELRVSVTTSNQSDDFLPAPGFIIDFKEIKKIVTQKIVDHLDHKLILSKAYLQKHPQFNELENLIIWDFEPSAENILLFIKNTLFNEFPEEIKLRKLLLYETKSSFVEWNETP